MVVLYHLSCSSKHNMQCLNTEQRINENIKLVCRPLKGPQATKEERQMLTVLRELFQATSKKSTDEVRV